MLNTTVTGTTAPVVATHIPINSVAITRTNVVCRKCRTVTRTSRRPSCCARGASWFGLCGDSGDTNFQHTWLEGIRACKGVSKPSVVIAQMVYPETVAGQANVTGRQYTVQRKINVSRYPIEFEPDEDNLNHDIEITSNNTISRSCGNLLLKTIVFTSFFLLDFSPM